MNEMKTLRFLALTQALLTCGCGPSNPTVKAIIGATLIDGTGAPALPDCVVIVNGNDIQAVGSRGSVKIPADAKEYSATGQFLVPGLIDVRTSLPSDAAKAAPVLRAMVKAGITTVGVADGGPAQRDASPRLLPAGAQMAGFADLVIASGGSSADAYFKKIERMAKAEVAPIQILGAATKNGAEWLKQDRLGVIAAGRKADLILLEADPLRDIRNLKKVKRVMVDGAWIQ
jgi:imidazolonepropionase-like amidohydrolase